MALIALFTDFGWSGPYTGQMRAVLARRDPAPAVVDLMHDAPRFAPRAAGHLLAALAHEWPVGSVIVGVVDPGVGTAREPVIVEADGRWFVGPANGLFDAPAARAWRSRWWRITREPAAASATFHGRDLFAPAAADLAQDRPVPGEPIAAPADPGAGADHAAVIYGDDFGNAMTGLRAPIDSGARLAVGDTMLEPGRTFADGAAGEPFWLVNSIGLVEIVVNQGRAMDRLGLTIGTPVAWRA
jgi:S-adenosylmethionine hydrolase